ncbi:MT-A70-domain-containing protein [Phanerochaete sordida]|uniref:MT-A70-domain-containing protein n=1 Tax=Phanerochaete sordida TaxID=48140 RepID=A0A9P3LBQ8_9APHY|nr:MT-A70-domain-containing protein [Phanerochaete sordida]
MSTAECIASAHDLLASHSALLSRVRTAQKAHRRALRALPSPPRAILDVPLAPSPPRSPPASRSPSPALPARPAPYRPDLPPPKRARMARYANYVPEEETIRNDYSQRYVDGGEWPQDWVLGADPEHRFEEYPKQQRLLALKKASVAQHALAPRYLPFSSLSSLHPSKFDVILIDPPFSSSFTWDDLQELPIPALAADPSFVLMWVGSGAGEGLERGREVMAKWGFRRCEDIVWVKTNNTTNRGPGTDPPTTSLLTRTKQHCLMGIRGTVRRSTDSWFVHCNVDTDVLIWEGDSSDPTLKPPEMYTLIENFCLGLRRLEIFGRARTLRPGWVSALAEGEEARIEDALGEDAQMEDEDSPVKWDRESYEAGLRELATKAGGKFVVPMTNEIDALRPKSPVRGGPPSSSSNMGAMQMSSSPSGMATPMSQHTHTRNFNQPPRMMGPPIMLGSVGQMGGLGGEGLALPMQNMAQNMGWQDPNVGMGGGMGMGGAQGMAAMNGMGGLGALAALGNMANLGNMGGNMGGMGMGGMNMNQFGGNGGFDAGGMHGMGQWEGQDMMGMAGMGIGGGGMGSMGGNMGGMNMGGGMGMPNAMGLNGMGMNGAVGPRMGGMNGGMGLGSMGGGMNNMGMGGMNMGQWRGR